MQGDVKKVNDLAPGGTSRRRWSGPRRSPTRTSACSRARRSTTARPRKEDVEKLKLLKGHVKKGQFVTKLRKVFAKDEMSDDLEFVRARSATRTDDIEYFSILPTSPP